MPFLLGTMGVTLPIIRSHKCKCKLNKGCLSHSRTGSANVAYFDGIWCLLFSRTVVQFKHNSDKWQVFMSLMLWQGHHSQEREVKPFGWESLPLSFVLTHQDNGQLIVNLLCRESLGLSLIKSVHEVFRHKRGRKNRHKNLESRTSTRLKLQYEFFSPEIMVNDFSVAAVAAFLWTVKRKDKKNVTIHIFFCDQGESWLCIFQRYWLAGLAALSYQSHRAAKFSLVGYEGVV